MRKILYLALAFSLLFACSASAEVEWKRFDFMDFSGGLNDGQSPSHIKDNEASDLQNVVFTTSGNFETRSGYTKINTDVVTGTPALTGITFYQQSDGDKFLVSVWDDDKIRKMEYETGGGPDGTWDDITGSLSFAVGQDDFASFAVGEDVLIIEDGVGNTEPYQWDGTGNAVTLDATAPNAKYVAYHKNMAFAAGDNDNLSTLYFTDIGDITAWDTGLSGNVGIETNDGSVIRGIKPGFDALYPWKDTSTWRLSGSDKDSFVLQRMVSDTGTESGQSVVRIGNDFIHMSDQGDIILYDGAVKVRNISKKIQGSIDNLAFNRFDNAPALKFEDDYYIAVTTVAGSTNNLVFVFDTFNLAWTVFNGMNVNAWCVADDGNGEDMIVFGDYSGFTYKYPSGINDAGTAIDMFHTSKWYRFPELTPEKYLRLLKVFANQEGDYNLTVEVRSDFEGTGTTSLVDLGGTTSLYGTAVFGTDAYGGENVIIGRIELENKGKDFFQIHFSNDELDQPVEIKGFSMWLEESDRI